jgi:hypothetical protein
MSPNTSFTTPDHDVTIIATYRAVPILSQTATPVIAISNGIPYSTVTISSATTNADIYFTFDGSDPTTLSTTTTPRGTLYAGPFAVSGNVTIKAIASAAYRPDSQITTANATVSPIALWRWSYFGNNWQNGSVAGDTSDPDGDGIANLFEYAFGLSPIAAVPTNLPTPIIASVGGTNYLEIRFSRDLRASDLQYTILSSADLANWVPGCIYSGSNTLTNTSMSVEVNRSGSPVESIVVRDANALTNGTRFMRIKVEVVP